jgi:ribonuclease HI
MRGIAVSIYRKGLYIVIDGYGIGYPEIPRANLAFKDYISKRQNGQDDEFVTALLSGDMLIMSDGSAKDNRGSAAWIITSANLYTNNIAIQGQVKVPIGTSIIDSYRAECFGIYGALLSLAALIQRSTMTIGDIVKTLVISFGCDNISALQRCFDVDSFPDISGKDSDFDILTAVRSLLPSLPVIQWRHVKGHQTGPNLDMWARLNHVVDVKAGDARESSLINEPPSDIHLEGEKWQVLINDKKVHKHLQTQIYEHLSSTTIFPYWVKKERFSVEGATKINWDALGTAMRQSTPRQRQWLTKRASRECGANYVLHKRNMKNTDKCPLCGEVETVLHIICCRDERAKQQWDMAVQDFSYVLNGFLGFLY